MAKMKGKGERSSRPKETKKKIEGKGRRERRSRDRRGGKQEK